MRAVQILLILYSPLMLRGRDWIVGKHPNDQILTKSVSFTMAGYSLGTLEVAVSFSIKNRIIV